MSFKNIWLIISLLEFEVEPPNHRNIEEAADSKDSGINLDRT